MGALGYNPNDIDFENEMKDKRNSLKKTVIIIDLQLKL